MNMNFNSLFNLVQDDRPDDERLYQNADRRHEDEDEDNADEAYGNRDIEGHFPNEYRGENNTPTVESGYPDEYRRSSNDHEDDRFSQTGRYYDPHDHSRFGYSNHND
jgi:hypothetical protein